MLCFILARFGEDEKGEGERIFLLHGVPSLSASLDLWKQARHVRESIYAYYKGGSGGETRLVKVLFFSINM